MGEAEDQRAGKPRSAKVKEDNGVSNKFTGLPELGKHVFATGIGQADNRTITDAIAKAEHAERTNKQEQDVYSHPNG